MSNKWALITGASSGIGKEFAIQLSKKQINTILVSDEEAELNDLSYALKQRFGVDSIPCYADLSDKNFMNNIKSAATRKKISILINNASFGISGKFLSSPLERYLKLIDVNVKAYVALTYQFLPSMIDGNEGVLIFVSSINAFSPIAESAIYSASKSFELFLGGALWHELKDTNIDVMVLLPGPTKTNFQKKAKTKVAKMALEPSEVVKGALAAVGKQFIYIPGWKNRILANIGTKLGMERRIKTASRGYKKLLHDKPDAGILELLSLIFKKTKQRDKTS